MTTVLAGMSDSEQLLTQLAWCHSTLVSGLGFLVIEHSVNERETEMLVALVSVLWSDLEAALHWSGTP